jgi:vacuolar protein sorting-associated protein 54
VELTLLNEVSTRSDGFFEALESYDHLSQQVALGRSQIEALRLRIRALEVNLVEKSLSLPRLVRQRANTAALNAKLRLVHAVWRTQPIIQQLLAAGDFPGALELITSSQQLLDTELRGVTALGHLGRGLAETKALIQDMMNKDLLQVALGYELEHGAPLMPVEALASELDLRLSPLALGLLRLRVLHGALRALQDQLKKDVRALIKRRLQELLEAHGEASRPTDAAAAAAATATAAAAADGLPASDATAADGSEPKVVDGGETVKPAKKIMDQLRELSLDGFEAVMAGVVAPLMVLLRRAAAIHTALKKALAASLAMSVTRHADGGEEEEEDAAGAYAKQVEQQSAETLQAVCELAHERYARLLKVTQRSHARPPLHCLCFVSPPRPGPPGSCQQVRKEVHTKLPLTLFVRVNRVAVEFIRDVQHLCGQPCHALGTELQQHANAFLDATHAEAARKLEAIVEVEQWKQARHCSHHIGALSPPLTGVGLRLPG